MGLDDFNITSGEEYASILAEEIRASHKVYGTGTEIEEEIIEYWCEEIKQACIKRYLDYVKGREDDYRLDDKEIMELYKKAIDRMTSEALDSLLERGHIQMSISGDGDIVYSSTEKGKKALKESDKSKKTNVRKRKKDS